MKVWRAYRALSPEQRKIVETKLVDTKGTPSELLALLGPVANYDAEVGKRLGSLSLGCVSVLAPLTTFVSLILGLQQWTPAVVAAFVAGATVTAVTWTLWYLGRKGDVSDNLKDTAIPLLKILRDDVARGETISLQLDLRQPVHKAKKTGVSEPYKRGAYYHITDTGYVDSWMTAKTRLNDGGLLAFRVIDAIRVMNRRKRGRRGKIKMNSRAKKKTMIKVQLAVRKTGFDVVAPEGGAIRSTDKRHVVSLSRSHKASDLKPVDPMRIVDALADAHRAVHRRRREVSAS